MPETKNQANQPLSRPEDGTLSSKGESKNVSKSLSLEPYKGTRDFYPEDQFIQNYIFSTWKKAVQKFGYLEYNASILEETELYTSKSGAEIVNEQTYTFIDRGGREVTIRPEMTPTVARMVASKRRELTFPLRWFSIPNLFRYERPQRGRLREHWQLNVDMFGVEGAASDAEVISVAYNIMKSFGAEDSQFVIRISSRKFMNFLMRQHFGLSEEISGTLSKLVDRKDKTEVSVFESQVKELLKDKTESFLSTLEIKNIKDFPEGLSQHESTLELSALFEVLRDQGITNVVFDPTIVRGFDYYTGVVFELHDTGSENNRALFGGGRYDDLVSIFNVEKVSGIGFGMGDVTIHDFLETYALLPVYVSTTQVYIAPFDETTFSASSELAAFLRAQGINTAVDLTDRKIAGKVKTADREKTPWLIVVGQDEITSGKFKLKNLAESMEYEVTQDQIITTLKKSAHT